MSVSNIVTHPRFAAVPVKNPPMRPGPKPKGTASFYAARGKRDRERRLRSLEQARKAEETSGARDELSDSAHRLADALRLFDLPKLQRLVAEAEKLAREYRAD